MRSMTGFGRSETETAAGRVVAEARSENHRFFDARVQLPENFSFLEQDILKNLKKSALRGKLKVVVVCETPASEGAEIDLAAARAVVSDLKKLKKNLGLQGDINLSHLLSFSDRIKKFPSNRAPSARTAAQVKKTADLAVEKLCESRALEGQRLRKDLKARARRCKMLVQRIKNERGRHEKEARAKIAERAKLLIGSRNVDEAKLYQEIVSISEKSDITEEIVRMNSHISRFSDFLLKNGASVGRELDFLTQEMNRESTTISAKSKSSVVSHLSMDLRSEIEKIREQAQNVE